MGKSVFEYLHHLYIWLQHKKEIIYPTWNGSMISEVHTNSQIMTNIKMQIKCGVVQIEMESEHGGHGN